MCAGVEISERSKWQEVETGHAPSHSEDRDSSSASSAGTIIPTESTQTQSTLAPWHDFFEQELFLDGPDIVYHIYITLPRDIAKDPLFICHHGGGSSGLSFALFAAEVRRRLPTAGVLSVDARGHGLTTSSDLAVNNDLSLHNLSSDLTQVIRLTQAKLRWANLPNMCLVGHSMGGAVVTQIAKNATFGAKLVGFGVVDVVEGSAMEYITHMQSVLAARPSSFDSLDDAIDWHTRSRTIRNHTSAAVSTPSLLQRTSSGKWMWRTDLAATKPYWEQWFDGMSKNFLAGKAAKLLLLAGTDRLDKELTIGQMQGKFQLQVFPDAGHFVQEDLPDQTAELVVEFFKRNDRSTLILPPKVSDLIAQGKKV